MSEECRFWLSWSVSALSALATFGAVVVAIFGERIKARYFPPDLRLSLVSPLGRLTPVLMQVTDPSGATESTRLSSRYYHVRVENKAKWPKATQVQICLVAVEEPGPDKEFKLVWAGEIPIRWMHQEIYPLVRDVGPAADCDLCSVLKDQSLQLFPILITYDLQTRRAKNDPRKDLIVTLEARAMEGRSPPLRVRIAWDGQWEDGDVEMQKHCSVKVV